MKLVTDQIEGFLSGGAWIRKIFEQGLELKKKYGEDAVCDFSLGNPDLPPPPVVGECLADLACRMDKPFSLGYMGDILTLIEKAQTDVDATEAAEMERKLRKAQFTLEDFRTQMRRVKKLGSLEGILKLIPGMYSLMWHCRARAA